MDTPSRARWGAVMMGLGCDAEPQEPPAVEDAAGVPATALELGRLAEGRAFEPFEPGQVLEIHQGPQGGFSCAARCAAYGAEPGRRVPGDAADAANGR